VTGVRGAFGYAFCSHARLVPDLNHCMSMAAGRRRCRLRGRRMSIQNGLQGALATADVAARRRTSVMAALVVVVVLLVLLSLGVGPVRLSPFAVIEALFGGGSDVAQVIVREILLPRAI